MPQARKRQVDVASTRYYHCMSRCVRRARLCGEDGADGRRYDHRKDWIVARMRELSSIFAIDVCAFAVLSNHYHIVVRLNPAEAQSWSNVEVTERWERLYGLPALVDEWKCGGSAGMSRGAKAFVDGKLRAWRERLADLSWFMKCLNEPIARRANQEDQCRGHFWESRFKSQPLLNEAALLACMAYVDLNPVRAGIARTPEFSEYTSIRERITEWAEFKAMQERIEDRIPCRSWVLPFKDDACGEPVAEPIPFVFQDYLNLVDWSARNIRVDKGHMDSVAPPILQRLGVNGAKYLHYISRPDERLILGPLDQIRLFARAVGKKFYKKAAVLSALFRPDG